MGISFAQDLRIAGYRPTVFKNAIRGFMRTRSRENVIDLRSIFPQRRDGAIVFEECIDRGLIDAEKLEITEKGMAIARGKAKRRTTLVQAHALLNTFLERVESLNRDPDALTSVTQVWLFGSLLRGEETVGDIDAAFKTEWRQKYLKLLKGGYEGLQEHMRALLSRFPGAPCPTWQETGTDWLLRRALYGNQQHHLYAGIHEDIHDLVSVGCPCRLIYDLSRGGRVDDPILPRHPESNGRSNTAPPHITKMPDLKPGDLRPMDARWVVGFGYEICPHDIFRGWTDEARKLFPRLVPHGVRVLTDTTNLAGCRWIPKRVRAKGLDGRSAVALVNTIQPPARENAGKSWEDLLEHARVENARAPSSGISLVLRRRIEKTSSEWTLHAWFEDLETFKNHKRVDPLALDDLATVVALILAGDAERMLRRATEEVSKAKIAIKVECGELDGSMVSWFVKPVQELLRTRTVRIEPLDAPSWQAISIHGPMSH